MFKRRKPEEPPASDQTPPPMSGPSPLNPGARPEPPRGAQDQGIGMPPRPVPPKDTQAMSRPPYPANPTNPQQAQRPNPAPGRQPAERRTLVVGRGITVHGTIQDAERLEVEGIVEATSIQAAALYVAPGGIFRGEAFVEEADIAGLVDGTVTVRGNLTIRSTGKVAGTAKYRRLQVEDGGQISGSMEMISEPPAETA